jgi:hypothetical protein
MIPLIKKLVYAFFYDELAAKRWLRGTLFFVGGMAVNVLAFPFTVVQAWTPQEWIYRVAAAGALGIGGSIIGGQKNKSAEEIRAELAALPYDGVDRRNISPDGPK